MFINPGEFNKKISLQSATITYDSYNEPIETWADYATPWAAITTTGGGEFYAAQRLHAETTALFKIRYKPGVTTAHRIKYGTRIFEILAVNNVNELNILLHISGKEAV